MKSLLKIYGKYVGATWGIIFLLFMTNIGVLFWIMFEIFVSGEHMFTSGISDLEKNIFLEDSEIQITQAGEKYLNDRGVCFLLVLSDDGDVTFSWNAPEDFASHYTAGDIAGFSRWYLNDYPVKVWQGERGLLVAGFAKDSVWKYPVEFSMKFMNNISRYFKILVGVNLLIIICIVFFLGYRFFRSLEPLSEGVRMLSQNKKVSLREKGSLSQLSAQLNRTSDILESQRNTLSRRDNARTEWIAGVSHDIRTPLAVIVGYADELSQSDNLLPEEKGKAEAIGRQSLKIGRLIEDLNLTSKLEYHMQPLREKPFYPAALLRRLTAEALNDGLGNGVELNLEVSASLEGISCIGDENLLARAITNLIDNSVKHNVDGCEVEIAGEKSEQDLIIYVRDNGTGIPKQVIDILEEDSKQTIKKAPHIMGLKLVKQIALAHGGKFKIEEEGHCVRLCIPLRPHTNT